ncbi:MAG: hypothetical protein M1835_002916 [Candelina submexicana]|nr:MAG: hypothetical protein M1835_002916 [Candelina submexicana]
MSTPLLLTTVTLTNEKLRRFVTQDHKWLSQCGENVRILSVRISSVWITKYADDGTPHLKIPDSHGDRLATTTALREHLRALSEIIEKYMPLLTCFSLFVDHSRGSLNLKANTWDAGFGIGVEELASLIKVLPFTCTSLELDADGKDMHKVNTIHICPIIRRLLPRLRHLRLRLKYICPSLLCTTSADHPEEMNKASHSFPACLDTAEYVQAHSLQSLVINLNNTHWMLWPWSFWRSELCSSLQDPPQIKQLRTGPVTIAPRPRVAAGPEFINACQRAISSRPDSCSFPSLKRFDVYEIAFDPDCSARADEGAGYEVRDDGTKVFSERVPDKGYQHTILQRDILLGEIRATPMRRPDPSVLGETWGVKTMDGEEHFGNADEIERLIEGPAWLETENELARVPAMIARSEDTVAAGYQWKAVESQSREEFESRADIDASRRQNGIPEVTIKRGMDWETGLEISTSDS